MRRFIVLSAVCVFVFLGQSNVMGDILYDVIEIASDHVAGSINDSGTVIGSIPYYTQTGGAVILDTSGNGQHVPLGSLGGSHGHTIDINENGVIVGWSTPSGNSHHVTIFDASGAGNNIDIGRGIYAHAIGNAINDIGQIVGTGFYSDSDLTSGVSHAVLFDETGNGNNIYLGTLGGAIGSAMDINNAGVIIGIATNNNGYKRGVVYDATGGGNNFDLGTLGGLSSKARDINENGQVVGLADDNNGNIRATLFGTYYGGSNLDLGTLGGDSSKTWAINELGEIVGLAQDASGNWKATLFDPTGAGANIDLNELIDPLLNIDLTNARDINNLGQIICYGYDASGNPCAYLLNPVRDPAELLARLVQDVVGLDLKRGTENSLLAKLGSALQKLDNGNKNNDKALINSLEAFINAVEAQSGKKILEADADALIDAAQQIIDLL